MDSLEDFVCYDSLLINPLKEVGWHVDVISWRKEDVDWSIYDLVIIRSTWDYQEAPSQFLIRLEEIDRKTHLQNSIETVKWNLDKSYLKDLYNKGISIVPTLWPKQLDIKAPSFFDALDTKEIIIKPTISANADDTFGLNADSFEKQKIKLQSIFKEKAFMVQPFVNSIITEGEYSLFYFAGEFSHSI